MLVDRVADVIDTHDPVAVSELAALIPDANPKSIRRTVYRLIQQGRIRRIRTAPFTVGRA